MISRKDFLKKCGVLAASVGLLPRLVGAEEESARGAPREFEAPYGTVPPMVYLEPEEADHYEFVVVADLHHLLTGNTVVVEASDGIIYNPVSRTEDLVRNEVTLKFHIPKHKGPNWARARFSTPDHGVFWNASLCWKTR